MDFKKDSLAGVTVEFGIQIRFQKLHRGFHM